MIFPCYWFLTPLPNYLLTFFPSFKINTLTFTIFFFFMCYPFSILMKILGHQKGGDLDLVPDLGGLVIDVPDLGPETDADTLRDLGPKKDGIGKKKENAARKAFLQSSQRLRVVSPLCLQTSCIIFSCHVFLVFSTVSKALPIMPHLFNVCPGGGIQPWLQAVQRETIN